MICFSKKRLSQVSNAKLGLIGLAMFALSLPIIPSSVLADQTFQSADLVDFVTDAKERGAGTLTRGMDDIWLNMGLQGLDKKAAYTVWWVVFNEPDECHVPGACGEPDLFELAVDASVFYATGFVSGNHGTANVTAHLHEGDIAAGKDVVIGYGSVIGGPNSCGDDDCDTGVKAGLRDDNGFYAEVHVVIRTHRKTIKGRVDEQISSFLGACEVKKGCEDQFALVFSPNP